MHRPIAVALLSGLLLAGCGQESNRQSFEDPQVVYDGSNETVIVVQDRDDDDLFWLYYLTMMQQHNFAYMAGYDAGRYSSYRQGYVRQQPAYIQPVRLTYTNTTNIITNPTARQSAPVVRPQKSSGGQNGAGSKSQPAQAPAKAPAQQPAKAPAQAPAQAPKSQPQQPAPKSNPQPAAPAPKAPAPAPRTK